MFGDQNICVSIVLALSNNAEASLAVVRSCESPSAGRESTGLLCSSRVSSASQQASHLYHPRQSLAAYLRKMSQTVTSKSVIGLKGQDSDTAHLQVLLSFYNIEKSRNAFSYQSYNDIFRKSYEYHLLLILLSSVFNKRAPLCGGPQVSSLPLLHNCWRAVSFSKNTSFSI